MDIFTGIDGIINKIVNCTNLSIVFQITFFH